MCTRPRLLGALGFGKEVGTGNAWSPDGFWARRGISRLNTGPGPARSSGPLGRLPTQLVLWQVWGSPAPHSLTTQPPGERCGVSRVGSDLGLSVKSPAFS